MDEVTLTMIYEYEVERSNNLYRHSVSVFPGEIVKDLQVEILGFYELKITLLRKW
jgi:hypothetical protein